MKAYRPALTALALGCAFATPALSQEAVKLAWQSTAADGRGLAQEFAELYVSLYNSENLEVQTVALGERFIEPAVRDAGVFFGTVFPVAMDALLCDLNSNVCSRARTPVDEKTLQDPTRHIGGFEPSPGRWRAGPRTQLVIPSYEFRTETSLARVPVDGSWTPKSFVASDGLDCSAWKMSCENLVAQFNPRLFGVKSSSGTATIPYLRYETRIGVGVDVASGTERSLENLFSSTESIEAETFAPRSLDAGTVSDSFRSLDIGKSTTDQLIRGVGENIKPVGRVKSYASHAPSDLAPDVLEQLCAINHPYCFGNDLSDLHQEPVTVGIIDQHIAKRHCGWPEVRVAPGDNLPIDDQDECGIAANGLLDKRDHVMLIGGIIAANDSERGVVGINPFADLLFMPLDLGGSAQNELQLLIQTLQSPEIFGTEIINLSSGVDRNEVFGSTEMLRIAIGSLQDVTLVVTAAGNEGLDLTDNCVVMPACMNELKNVISVVGLNRDHDNPTIWQSQTAGSNTHPDFDIGAVAENVYSSVSSNRYGKDSGTSFAVPQVTAAASLVLAAAKRVWSAELDGARISPKFLKDRLIYTADIKPGLNGRMRSGRLNVGRAIDVSRDQYVLFDGRVISGQTLERPTWFKCQTPVAGEEDQLFWNLRRMTFQEDTGRHFLFKHSPDDAHLGDRNAPLDEFASCLVTTLSPTVSVRTSPTTVEEFRFGDIRDFTSRFIETL